MASFIEFQTQVIENYNKINPQAPAQTTGESNNESNVFSQFQD